MIHHTAACRTEIASIIRKIIARRLRVTATRLLADGRLQINVDCGCSFILQFPTDPQRKLFLERLHDANTKPPAAIGT